MQSNVISDDEDLPSSETEQEWSEEEDDIPMIGTGFAPWLVIVRGWAHSTLASADHVYLPAN